MQVILLVLFLLVSVGLIGLIMLQQGKGADMGASFGAGASATLFGSSGSGNFMSRTTAILATLFFIISLVLGNMSSQQAGTSGSGFDDLSIPATEQTTIKPVEQPKPANSDIPN